MTQSASLVLVFPLLAGCGLVEGDGKSDGAGWSGEDPFQYYEGDDSNDVNAPKPDGSCAVHLPAAEASDSVVWSLEGACDAFSGAPTVAIDRCDNAWLSIPASSVAKILPSGEQAWISPVPNNQYINDLAVSPEGTAVVAGFLSMFYVGANGETAEGPDIGLLRLHAWEDAWFGAGSAGYGLGKIFLPSGEVKNGGFEGLHLNRWLDAKAVLDQVYTLRTDETEAERWLLRLERRVIPRENFREELYLGSFTDRPYIGALAVADSVWIAAAFASNVRSGAYIECSGIIGLPQALHTECFLPGSLFVNEVGSLTAFGLTPRAGAEGYTLTRLTIQPDGSVTDRFSWPSPDVPTFAAQQLAVEKFSDGSLVVAGIQEGNERWWAGRIR